MTDFNVYLKAMAVCQEYRKLRAANGDSGQ
jgi:hypothetical protein